MTLQPYAQPYAKPYTQPYAQPYAMIYHDNTRRTLHEGMIILQSISNPILCYQQILRTDDIYSDIAYRKHVNHDPANEQIILSFPPECIWIANLRNSHNCKMVTYHKDIETSFIKEITVIPSMNFDLMSHDVSIIIYTNGKTNIEIYFDVYLVKKVSKL